MSDLGAKLKQQRATAERRMNRHRMIDFQIDTLATSGTTLGYFSGNRNSVTINYRTGNSHLGIKRLNEMAEGTTIDHEQKHRDNAAQGMKNYAVSLEQAYKLDMHDEISANMAQLIVLREKYLQTGDIHVFDINISKFKFYVDALKKGEINPHSDNQADFDREMSLIANGTQKMWMDKFASTYIKQNTASALNFYHKAKDKARPNEKNYNRGLDIAYNIGGVNFRQYLKQDVECTNPQIQELDQKIASGKKYNELVGTTLGLPEYQENMSLEQYYMLSQHHLIADELKNYITANKQDVEKLSPRNKKLYAKMVSNYAQSLQKQVAQKQGTLNYNILKVVGDKGDRFLVPSENKDAFERELDKLYTIKGVNYRKLLNIEANDVPCKVPAEVSKFADSNVFMRSLRKIGRAEVNAYNKVKSWFVNDNNPIIPLNKEKPKYRTWSPTKRVSEVQHKEVLDLTKDVIRKPQKTVADKPEAAKPNKITGTTAAPKPKEPTKGIIPLNQITATYSAEQISLLCKNPERWKQGRECDSAAYQKVSEITGLPSELIAYAYEVNRRNFPKEASRADKVRNGSTLSDQQMISEIAEIMGKYDIEKGKFFNLRETPRKIAGSDSSHPSPSVRPKGNLSEWIKELQGIGSGADRLLVERSLNLRKQNANENQALYNQILKAMGSGR